MPRPAPVQRHRLRFERAEREAARDGHDTIAVTLEWENRPYRGEASGVHTREGELRTSASATLAATREILGEGGPRLELLGIKAVRAFDGWVVIASIELRTDADPVRLRLLGARTCEDDDLIRAAAIATLDALNRVLERWLRAGPPPE